ncbi:MFS general substrate transporter [Polychaeton citri CBS 116435]|uniref:MFS general substrate transporter n=1 Tax=Polychaeton citri CBS 116435 TaxID=1314669 RepID=A0A9P4Q9E7_9PEZI|nr:MFS general substrate transporter [Polychaeton citri CBS 116435]
MTTSAMSKGATEQLLADDTPTSSSSVSRNDISLKPSDSYEGSHRWDPDATWTPQEETRVVRKIDSRLLAWICVMFFGLQLDRGNLSNALTDDLLNDLDMTPNDYNNGTTVQLICFLATEFPVQLLIKRYGFKQVLPFLMMAWGTVSWTQAFMTGRVSFYITRALIGACEGGFIPGTILFATYFYTSKELSLRLAAFWSTLNIARMRGIEGRPGWFWLFLIEGLLTFLIGFISYFYLPLSPTHTKGVLWRRSWFTEREEVIVVNRILRDDPAKGVTGLREPATFRDVINTWKDSSMWGMYFIGLIAYIPAGPVQSYLSLTLRRIGFSTFDSNMLSIPSAVLQIILMLALAFSSDYFTEHPYFHPIVSAWISENSFDVKKRAITAATYNVIVQIGSIISSQTYRADDAPYYPRGNLVLISLCALSLVTFLLQKEYLRFLNRRKARIWSGMSNEEQSSYKAEQVSREKDGNRRLDFRFQY